MSYRCPHPLPLALFTFFKCKRWAEEVKQAERGSWLDLLWTECSVFPQVHTLKPNSQCDGIRRWGPWKVIRFRWGLEAPMMDWCSSKKRKRAPTSLHHALRKGQVSTQQKGGLFKSGREFSSEPNHAGATDLNSNLWTGRKLVSVFKAPNLWYFVITAWANKDRCDVALLLRIYFSPFLVNYPIR